MSRNGDFAKKYAKMGFYVFPLNKGGKIPVKGSHGFYEATTDSEKIDEWWKKDPEYNIGVRCGHGFKIFALDIDRKKTGEIDKNGFIWLKHQDDLPDTAEFITPSTGQQQIFLMPEESLKSSSDEIAEGIDIRADGGYTIFPPSFVKATNKYKYEGKYMWLADQSVEEIAIQKCPEWLLDEIRKTSPMVYSKAVEDGGVLTMDKVIKEYKINIKELANGVLHGTHPIHGSSNGMNFRIDTNKNVWACYRHRDADGTFIGGGTISLVAMLEGIIACEQCIPKGLTGENYKKTIEIIEKRFGIPRDTFSKDSINSIIVDIKALKEEKEPWLYLKGLKLISLRINNIDKRSRLEIISFAKDYLNLKREQLTLLKMAGKKTLAVPGLDINDSGAPNLSDKNLLKIFNEDDELKSCFKRNLFSGETDVFEVGEWCVVKGKCPRQLNNMDPYQIKTYLINKYNMEYKKMSVDEAIMSYSISKSYDPLLDYLDSLKWDGVNRLETWLIDYLGTIDNPYTRYTARLMLVGAINRAYEPGCQYDHVVVLAGEQGILKTSVIEALGSPWFESLSLAEKEKDTIQKMKGKWFIELGEGVPFKRKEINELKNFLTTKDNKERFAYERHTEMHKRRSVFMMTINPQDIGYLPDPTGNRRFLPVRMTTSADIKGILKVKDQLFAEAIELYKKEFKIYIDKEDGEVYRGLLREHEIAETQDDWYITIQEWLLRGYSIKKNKEHYRETIEEIEIPNSVSCGYIWEYCFNGDIKNYTPQREGARIGRILNKMGAVYRNKRMDGGQKPGYDIGPLINGKYKEPNPGSTTKNNSKLVSKTANPEETKGWGGEEQ